MIALFLALVAAMSYGLADFIGGFAGRRASAWSVALVAQVTGTLGLLIVALGMSGRPTSVDLAWGAAAGVANGVGTAFLYRGLSSGRMGVVAPVSGVGAAVIPVLVAVVLGERPATLAWIGMLAALPGIWLVSRESEVGRQATEPASTAFLDGMLAGTGFGLLFVCLSRVPEEAGLLPLALNQLIAGVAVIGVAVAMGKSWVPRERAALWGMVGGTLATAATVAFLFATHTGLLSITAVVTSLYPAFTVLLAVLLLREHIHRAQALGLVLCAVAVTLVAAG